MVNLDLLDGIETFKGLNDAQLTVLRGLSEKLKFNRNDRLFLQGEDSEHLWFVTNGRIELRDDQAKQSSVAGESPISFISETEVFGWSSFMVPYKYRLSGYCSAGYRDPFASAAGRNRTANGAGHYDPVVVFPPAPGIYKYLLPP
jgi:hypothetical protein